MAGNCASNDLLGGKAAWFVWCLPAALIFIGFSWEEARIWLWVPSLLVMGTACLLNAGRCGRLHCYVTGPLFLVAPGYLVLAEFHLVPFRAGRFLLIVLAVTALACFAELPFGRYVKKA